jgi:uncharacterized protein (DUF2062 family)/SAM-dependent methyltransferase
VSEGRTPTGARARIAEGAKRAWARLRGGELTPWRAAASVAVGLLIGVTPLWGLHFWLVVAVCVPLRLDAAVAYLAANISLPFIAPFLTFAELEIGAWILTGHATGIDLDAVRAHRWSDVAHVADMLLVGTLVFAPAIALVGGALTFGMVTRARRRTKTPFDVAVDRVAARYAGGRRATFHYVRSKLAGDPVAAAIAAIGELGDVVDVGCGRGQLGVLLLEMGRAARVVGFDWDAKKIDDARAAATGLAMKLEVGDVRDHAIDACDTVLLVDVLHYMTDDAQDALLARAAIAARRRVVVRELDPDRGWRSMVTRLQERITTGIAFNRGERLRIRPIARIEDALRRAGFDVAVTPCWGSMPFANVLVIATRAGSRN